MALESMKMFKPRKHILNFFLYCIFLFYIYLSLNLIQLALIFKYPKWNNVTQLYAPQDISLFIKSAGYSKGNFPTKKHSADTWCLRIPFEKESKGLSFNYLLCYHKIQVFNLKLQIMVLMIIRVVKKEIKAIAS